MKILYRAESWFPSPANEDDVSLLAASALVKDAAEMWTKSALRPTLRIKRALGVMLLLNNLPLDRELSPTS
jgi:hypothetical protein